ncbi:MAG: S8 family serine peptidase, partial [Rhodospirillales bacterium]|nr:S8 family serine peptidase [Rhodospirillales bacterium]
VDGAHPDLKARWRGGSNSWFDPYGQHAQPTDMNGHGTHVAGLTVGGAAGGTAIGVAPDARWIAAKAFDDNGYGTLSGLHLAFQWTLDPDGDPATRDAPDVVNASWGLMGGAGQCNGEFQPDIDALRAAGIVVVFSAGNDGPNSGTSQSPGNNAGALAVGALDSAMTVPDFSSRGPSACDGGLYPALAAPGVAVKTPDLSYGGIFPDAYALVTGTSFSAPHVSGAVALLASAVPWATPDQIGNALKQSAQDAGTAGPDNQSGQGLIDVAAAYALIKNLPPPDGDGDGHPVITDCDDTNAAIHPGAAEIRSDGIDQDCNGYDLTITIVTSSYSASAKKLTVEATSALKQAAGLKLDGHGPMSWDTKKQRWVITVTGVAVKPAHVTVSGIEGSVTR